MRSKYLVIILAVMLFAFSGCQKPKPEAIDLEATKLDTLIKTYFTEMPDHSYKIDNKEFIRKVKTGEDFVVIDLRNAKDYNAGHIKGAINMPWGPAVAENLNKIPQGKEVLIYCYTGQSAGQAVMTLNLAGIQARSVNMGWNKGISKIEGVNAVTETTGNAFGTDVYPVNSEIQEALTAYYRTLADLEGTKFENYRISKYELEEMDKKIFLFMDIRKAEDFAINHIKDAKNIPFGKDLIEGLSDVHKDKKIIVYCYTGQTAGQVIASMRLLGYDAVSLNGGFSSDNSGRCN